MATPVPTPRLLLGMTVGAVVATVGALFLGEYEFDEALPIGAGVLLGYIIAEAVVSIGKQRSRALALIVASWAGAAVLLAGHLDANGNESIKAGAFLSAGASAMVAGLRAHAWFAKRKTASV